MNSLIAIAQTTPASLSTDSAQALLTICGIAFGIPALVAITFVGLYLIAGSGGDAHEHYDVE